MPKHLGISGDRLDIQGDFITKTCLNDQERFIKNITKQQSFINPFLNAVPIVEHSINQCNQHYIVMPYVKCSNALVWLSRSSITQIAEFIFLLNNYFTSILESSELRFFEPEVWQNKITDLQRKINDPDLLFILIAIKDFIPHNLFYYGDNHGDFTLSNLFICDEKTTSIYLIDFLDTFIQSPLNDIVKFRQDTKHLWTFRMINDSGMLDYTKILIILNFIDNQITTLINQNHSLSECYIPFQILNLMRIIPYNNEPTIFIHLKQEIIELFNDFNRDCALRRA